MKKLNKILNIINLILAIIVAIIFAINNNYRLVDISLLIISIVYLYLILKAIYQIYINDVKEFKNRRNWKGKR